MRRVDPITKLTYFFCFIIMSFAVSNIGWGLVLLLFSLGLLLWAGEIRRVGTLFLSVLVLIISIFVIQGMFSPDNQKVALTIGPLVFYQEGLLFAGKLSLRIFNILTAGALLVLTTPPDELMDACVRRGLSPKVGYMITTILQIVPQMLRTAAKIREAQESRGMVVKGGLWIRMKAFIPLLSPLIMSSFVGLKERSIAIEVRGFSAIGKRTFLREEVVMPGAIAIRTLLIALTIATISWRVFV